MMKDDIQVGSIVVKTTPGSKGSPLMVQAVNSTHAKIYYLSSKYQEDRAKWYPKSDLALYMVPVPEKKPKNFIIRCSREIQVQAIDLSVGDFVIVKNSGRGAEFLEFGQVVGEMLDPIITTNFDGQVFKLNMTEVELKYG